MNFIADARNHGGGVRLAAYQAAMRVVAFNAAATRGAAMITASGGNPDGYTHHQLVSTLMRYLGANPESESVNPDSEREGRYNVFESD